MSHQMWRKLVSLISILAIFTGIIIVITPHPSPTFAEEPPSPNQTLTPTTQPPEPEPIVKTTALSLQSPLTKNNLTVAVEKAVIEYLGFTPIDGMRVSNITRVANWAFGTVGIIAPPVEGAAPEGLLFIAQKQYYGWEVVIEHTPKFRDWVSKSPDQLISKQTKGILASDPDIRGNGFAQLSLFST